MRSGGFRLSGYQGITVYEFQASSNVTGSECRVVSTGIPGCVTAGDNIRGQTLLRPRPISEA